MKAASWSTMVLALAALGACTRPPADTQTTHHGRYVGVGIYSPGQLWQRMVTAEPPANAPPEAARTSDDEQVIVVVDSDTGEIRQCGNLSGYCVGLNPWTKALTSQQQLPASMTVHALKLPPVEPAPAPPAKP
jgi:hypothetical protein